MMTNLPVDSCRDEILVLVVGGFGHLGHVEPHVADAPEELVLVNVPGARTFVR